MATIAITSLPAATAAAVTDVLPIVQSGTTKQVTNALLFTNATLVAPALGTVASGNISACTSTSMVLTTPNIGAATGTSLTASGVIASTGTAGVGYATGAGGTVTQLTSRVTLVTLNKRCGAITMFSAAGSATPATFQVNNSTVGANDVIILNQASGSNLYSFIVTTVAAGSFNISFFSSSGVAVDAPVINFAVIKAVAA
jgi:hypothetical protein